MPETKNGRVIKSTGSWHTVQTEEGKVYDCKVRGRFRIEGIKSTNPVAVGDKVSFEVSDEEAGQGIITKREQRKNHIVRRSSNLSKQTSVMAANVDYALLVATVDKPRTTSLFMDRFLVSAEAYSIPAVIVFNKLDLYSDKENERLAEWTQTYQLAGYPVLQTSVVDKTGIEELANMMSGNMCVLAGHSGVGKSSLINLIEPGLRLKTSEISAYHQSGQHTTTFVEMHPLSQGGYIIDTPGIKGFGIFDIPKEEIYHHFPELFTHASQCKFHNCLHMEEPGCAVREAVIDGKIALSRYDSYLAIMEGDDEGKYRKDIYAE